MPAPTDTSDLRALARVILDQEDLEQAAMRPSGSPYDLDPIRRQSVKGLRIGSLLGLTAGLASSGVGTSATFRQPAWVATFAVVSVAGSALGASVGAAAGLVKRWSQRRRLDRELAVLVAEHRR
jgi:hypothetical protein